MFTRSMISSKKLGTEIGYVEGSEAFDLRGRKRCIYEPATGNLLAFDSGKIVGHVSLAGNFIGLSWLADELFPHSNDPPNIASSTPIKATVSMIQSTALAEKSQLNIARDERAEAADKGSAAHTSAASLRPSTDVNLTDKKWLPSATLNDTPETTSDTPIETNIRIQSIELAGNSGPNIVRDGHAETASQGGTAHVGAASPQPTANVDLTDKKWLSDATLNDMPETPATPIETTMIQLIELAVKPQPNVVHDANAETADKGGVAHTSVASPQSTADINRIDEEWLAKATEELVMSYSVRIKSESPSLPEKKAGKEAISPSSSQKSIPHAANQPESRFQDEWERAIKMQHARER